MIKEIRKDACLLFENAKLIAAVTRSKHARDRRVLKKLARFFVMSFHHSCLCITNKPSFIHLFNSPIPNYIIKVNK